MRRFVLFVTSLAAAVAAIAVLAGPTLAQTVPAEDTSAATTRTDTVRGIEISPGAIVGDTRFGATFVGRAGGDLPGFMEASINYTPPRPGPKVTNTIVGGRWFLSGPWGLVFGSFTGGTVRWNADGTLANVVANMRVLGGRVNGVPVLGRDGTFRGVLDHRPLAENRPPTVGGTLKLTF